ncbi:NlpC/P60 family protein [Anaerotignum sp. MB30-C6]|uniref:NlpC/P60 family protein n=1 Tax=Anaerotignum sp. MB30-C6 TaxID=3070814 RepID=UPI0027DE5A4B|nr:NlpC/P60 family protein [Anaerotignum sp. MB30-C6]WMI80339.1 NlpC/P60 family protein [Anaerotignum sp. MB30-C6]
MTGQELVAFARSKLGTPYVYGMKGTMMTQANYNYLQSRYGKKCVWDSDEKKVGKVCVDCSGLISWATGVILGSSQIYDWAIRKESITTIKNAPKGALVWMRGHVGIYTGLRSGIPYYIAADGSAYGVREVPLSKNKFTHWLLMDYITYERGDGEMVEKGKIIVDGEEVPVELIFKDGTNYVKVRDLGEALGCKVSSNGKIAVLERQ